MKWKSGEIMKQNVEILAPAGSYDSFIAAVHAGSDAVYLGGKVFSARASADNFTQEQIFQALDYAHLHGRKIYMTVNTLLKESEIKYLPEYLLPYYEHGLDAVIVQDVGVLKTVAENFPDLPIHLSTQMTLTGAMGVQMFQSNPIHRLIPARELSLQELKHLKESTELELEVFVHGALCICYSGQCFLSSMIGGRSGNRGRCAQPCRQCYSSRHLNQESYVLSTKDLCTLEMIPDLIETGIDSFKIEGRMKKPEYVAYISWLYRKYANYYFQYGRKEYEAYLRKYPEELKEDLQGMKDLYNRGGFTKGYFFQHHGKDMMSPERPNHEGVFVGTVISVKGRCAEILWHQEIYPQDILEIRLNGKKIYEYTIGAAQKSGEKGTAIFSKDVVVKQGMKVFRTKNNHLLSWIDQNLIANSMKIELCGEFLASVGQAISFKVECKRHPEINITVVGEICQAAQKQPMTEEMVHRQLLKLGGTDFIWKSLKIQLKGEVFISVKDLNELRRKALKAFQEWYVNRYQRVWNELKIKPKIKEKEIKSEMKLRESTEINRGIPKIAAEVLTAKQWRAAISCENVYIIYARMEIVEKKEMISLAELTILHGKKCLLSFPLILRKTAQKLVRDVVFMMVSKQLCNGILVHNIEELGFVKKLMDSEQGRQIGMDQIEVIADFSMYSTNCEAIRFWKEQGCCRVTASIEQNAKELKELFSIDRTGIEKEICVYGRLPCMVLAQCLVSYDNGKNCRKSQGKSVFTDEWKETWHSMNFCRFCYNILYSGRICDLRGEGKTLFSIPCSVWRCSFTDETEQKTKEILNSFHIVLEGKSFSGSDRAWTGHFHRGMI